MNQIKWTITNVILAIIIIAAMIGVMFVALQVFGVTIPSWAVTIFWICVVAFVACIAVKFIASMFGGGPPSGP
jgi:hypothetical protein